MPCQLGASNNKREGYLVQCTELMNAIQVKYKSKKKENSTQVLNIILGGTVVE